MEKIMAKITTEGAKITKKREDELRKLGQELAGAALPRSAIEDEVSICETVRRGFNLHVGEELTLYEATLVLAELNCNTRS
jgi:hypothetical protein